LERWFPALRDPNAIARSTLRIHGGIAIPRRSSSWAITERGDQSANGASLKLAKKNRAADTGSLRLLLSPLIGLSQMPSEAPILAASRYLNAGNATERQRTVAMVLSTSRRERRDCPKKTPPADTAPGALVTVVLD
jgi:hypothetical protein